MTGHIPDMQLFALIFSPRIFVMSETLVCGFTVRDVAVNILLFRGKNITTFILLEGNNFTKIFHTDFI
jgi:hypothetical protein